MASYKPVDLSTCFRNNGVPAFAETPFFLVVG